MLKRANGEVKIGNKNKIAPAALVVCVGNKASLRPAGRAPLSPSQMRNVSPPPCPAATRTSASHPGPRAGPASKRHQRTGFAQRCCPPAVWPPTRSRAPSRRLGFLSSSRSADPPGTDGGGVQHQRPPRSGRAPRGLPHTSLCQVPLQDPPHVQAHSAPRWAVRREHTTRVRDPAWLSAQTSISSTTQLEEAFLPNLSGWAFPGLALGLFSLKCT